MPSNKTIKKVKARSVGKLPREQDPSGDDCSRRDTALEFQAGNRDCAAKPG